LFYYFLQQRGLKPELAFVADRRDKMVDSEVHEWQFDASVVLLPTRNNKYETFAPAIPDLPAGSIPYYYEGTKVLKIDSTACTWIYLPFSADRANTIKRSLDLQLSTSAEPTGLFSEQSTGQFAWMRRSLLRNVDSLEVMESLMEELKGLAPLAEIDSIRYANPDKLDSCFIITCKMRFPKLVRHIGRTYFLQPSNYYEFIDNPLTAEKRESPIVFGFAYDQQETICFRPSPDWLIVSFPGNTSFPHSAGRIEMLYTEVEKVLSMQRNLRLRTIYWKASDYPLLQRYFQKRTLLNNELVVLEKKE